VKKPIWDLKIAALAISSLFVGFFVFVALKSLSNQSVAKLNEQSRSVNLAASELDLGVQVIESTNGWNLVQFLDYSCEPCRKEEARIVKEIQEHAPEVGRSVMLWPNPLKPESAFPARAVLLADSQDVQSGKLQHRNMMILQSHNKETILEMRPPPSIINRTGISEDSYLANLMSQQVSDRLKKTDSLAKRLGLMGVPAYLLVAPSGEGSIVGSLDDWKKLVKEKGLSGQR
jgi:hypothetical protein